MICRGIIFPGWRENLEHAFTRAVETAAKGGIEGVEAVAGIPDAIGPKRYGEILSDNGMVPSSLHVAVVYENRPELAAAKEMMMRYGEKTREAKAPNLVCSWVCTGHALGAGDFAAARELYEECGAILKKDGVRLLYHNHAAEFEGGAGDAFVEEFSKANGQNFAFAMDIGWAAWAGYDIKKLADGCGRLMGYLHLRDFAGRNFTAVGQGENDIAAHISRIKAKTDIGWIGVEIPIGEDAWQEGRDEPIIRLSAEGLRNLL